MITDFIGRIKTSIQTFTSNPLNNGGFLIPVAIGVLAVLSGIVNYIRFIVTGGYTNQVRLTKEVGLFSGYEDKFTTGTTGMITAGIIGKIVLGLLCLEMIFIMIGYFRDKRKVKRMAMIITVAVFVVQMVVFCITFGVWFKSLALEENIAAYGIIPLLKVTEGKFRNLFIVYGIVLAVAFVSFCVLLLISDQCRWMLGYTTLAMVVAKIIVPLVFLFLQNVIPLVTGVVALVLMAVAVVVGAIVFLGILSSGADNAGASQSVGKVEKKDNTKSYASEKKEIKNMSEDQTKKDNCAYITDLNAILGIKLYKVHGMVHDYIALDNMVVTREVCSIEALEKGRFHIYDQRTGREVHSSEIPWQK